MSQSTDVKLSLQDMQADFAAKLVWREEGLPRTVVCHNSRAPQKRFNVYRNNVFAGLTETLKKRFPVVERLVGADFFQAAARHFIAAHPPRSPALVDYGGGFVDFLESFEPAASLPYLPDVARLEWLRHQAFHAADAEPMPPGMLAEIPAEQVGDIVLRLHPSAGLLDSDHPVLSIWETNVMDAEVRRITSDMKGEAVLILRPVLDVVILRLGPGGADFIRAIGQGAPLADAAERAAGIAPGFDLAGALGALLASGAFAGFSMEPAWRDEGE